MYSNMSISQQAKNDVLLGRSISSRIGEFSLLSSESKRCSTENEGKTELDAPKCTSV